MILSDKKKRTIAFFAMVVGMFMAILDIQIVASSLPNIGAGLSASTDELSWIQTAYLISEVIIIPIAGFLTRVFSTRIVYFVGTLGFTIMSILCAASWNIQSMIIFRLLQGLLGGVLIPITFATTFILFDAKERLKANIIVGLVVTVAPTLGPIIGGYLTEVFSWHLMFLLNVIPGIFVATAVFLFVDFDKPNLALFKNFDYWGVVLIAVGLGTLQYILEEGNRLGWFDSRVIIILLAISISSLVAFVINEMLHSNPILELRTFSNRNFTMGCIFSFVVGSGLYGVVFLLPMFLARIAGMNSLQVGMVMVVTGLSQFISAPIASTLYSKGLSSRLMFFIGLNSFACGCYLNSFLTEDSRFYELLIPQVVRGMSLMFCFIPMSNIALGDLSKEKVKSSSGLYNLMRNLGGAIGLALINLGLIDGSVIYSQYIAEHIKSNDPFYLGFLAQLNAKLLSAMPNIQDKAAIAILDSLIQKNAFIISVNNIFATLAFLFFVSSLLLIFVKKTQSDSSVAADAH
jgi:DHA2 family multidrug resistance protein